LEVVEEICLPYALRALNQKHLGCVISIKNLHGPNDFLFGGYLVVGMARRFSGYWKGILQDPVFAEQASPQIADFRGG
jgi:hypothetical protein